MKTPLLAVVTAMAIAFPLTATANPSTDTVEKRQVLQLTRLLQGTVSGEITLPELKKLGQTQTRINDYKMEAEADGHISVSERAKLWRMQDRAGARLFKQKHDRQAR